MICKPSNKTKVYLATSYSYKIVPGNTRNTKWYSLWRQWLRYRKVTKATAYWLIKGYNVFSPITHSHPLPKYIPARLDTHTMWLGLDFAWIDCCDELWVFMQDGWRDSYGVKKEIEYAKTKEMPIRYVTENNYMYLNERARQLNIVES